MQNLNLFTIHFFVANLLYELWPGNGRQCKTKTKTATTASENFRYGIK